MEYNQKLKGEIRVLQQRLRDANRGAERNAKSEWFYRDENRKLQTKVEWLRLENKLLKEKLNSHEG